MNNRRLYYWGSYKNQRCPATTMQAPRGEEVLLLLIIDLDTRLGWVVSVTTRPRFAPGKEPAVPIVQEAGWAWELISTQRLEKNRFLCRGSNPGCPVCSQTLYTDWATLAPDVVMYDMYKLSTDYCLDELQSEPGYPHVIKRHLDVKTNGECCLFIIVCKGNAL
jgi:hypothetical protein